MKARNLIQEMSASVPAAPSRHFRLWELFFSGWQIIFKINYFRTSYLGEISLDMFHDYWFRLNANTCHMLSDTTVFVKVEFRHMALVGLNTDDVKMGYLVRTITQNVRPRRLWCYTV
jgi:hypothetical protein